MRSYGGLMSLMDLMGFHTVYPLVMTNVAIEHGHRNTEFSHTEKCDIP